MKDYDLQEVLNEMKTVRTVSIQGSCKRYTTELTPFQKKIFGLSLNSLNQCINKPGF